MLLDFVKDNFTGVNLIHGHHPCSGGAPCTSNRLPIDYHRVGLHDNIHWSYM